MLSTVHQSTTRATRGDLGVSRCTTQACAPQYLGRLPLTPYLGQRPYPVLSLALRHRTTAVLSYHLIRAWPSHNKHHCIPVSPFHQTTHIHPRDIYQRTPAIDRFGASILHHICSLLHLHPDLPCRSTFQTLQRSRRLRARSTSPLCLIPTQHSTSRAHQAQDLPLRRISTDKLPSVPESKHSQVQPVTQAESPSVCPSRRPALFKRTDRQYPLAHQQQQWDHGAVRALVSC